MKDDEARPEAIFRYNVHNIKELKDSVLSPPCYIRNLPWKILVNSRQAPSLHRRRQQQRFLGFFLQCNGKSESSSWSCSAAAELRLISHKPGIKVFSRKVQHLFYSKENDWGYTHFMPWGDLLDPDKGYVKDDTITLEVHVTAEKPHGISAAVVDGYKIGTLINEDKTKQVYELVDHPDQCLFINKDETTAGHKAGAHDLEGKAAISNQTNAKVFDILKSAGIKTSFVKTVSPTAFASKKCEMVPIEWVTRRAATGSFLKRNPTVSEGFRFTPPKLETFFKDAKHDMLWSEKQIVSAKCTINGLTIGQDEVEYMKRATILVFEILEKAWALRDCALIDMKIKFGVDLDGNILLADTIDFDSWTLWPSGDKRLGVNKQVNRRLTTDLAKVKRYSWIKDQLEFLQPTIHHKVVVFKGSPDDEEHCQNIAKAARELGLDVDLRVTSADKATEETLSIMQQYEDTHGTLVFIVVAGSSSGLGPVLSGNTSYPVINCPPPSETLVQDIWPSGLGCATVSPGSAALMAAQIIGLQDYIIWARLRSKQLDMAASSPQAEDRNECLIGGYLYNLAF